MHTPVVATLFAVKLTWNLETKLSIKAIAVQNYFITSVNFKLNLKFFLYFLKLL